jgi:uncharacterized protein with GYD domain
MAKYLITGSYTAQGAKGVLAEGGTGRREATERVVSSVGGSVEAYYFGFGGNDFYVIADFPGHAAVVAAALTGAAAGGMTVSTTVLLTPEEIDEAAKLSPDYRAPGA